VAEVNMESIVKSVLGIVTAMPTEAQFAYDAANREFEARFSQPAKPEPVKLSVAELAKIRTAVQAEREQEELAAELAAEVEIAIEKERKERVEREERTALADQIVAARAARMASRVQRPWLRE
jgi:hypothetical protein